jgi:spore coat polysaccharide biosynthesis protein SpsF (cytidylyltransferase family)
MGSTRLPGKVLAQVAGKPVVRHVVERVRRAALPDHVVVATSVNPENDAIEEACRAIGVECARGSENDVLDRYRQVVRRLGADAVVRVTSDCPLLDPGVLDSVISMYEGGGYDYASNINPPTFPHGLDVEICSAAALERSWTRATAADEREHVTLHIRRRPGEFRIGNLRSEPDLSGFRWVLDLPSDLDFVRDVYERLGTSEFAMEDVLALLERDAELARRARVTRGPHLPEPAASAMNAASAANAVNAAADAGEEGAAR